MHQKVVKILVVDVFCSSLILFLPTTVCDQKKTGLFVGFVVVVVSIDLGSMSFLSLRAVMPRRLLSSGFATKRLNIAVQRAVSFSFTSSLTSRCRCTALRLNPCRTDFRLSHLRRRFYSSEEQRFRERNKNFFIYLTSVALGVLGLSYAAVPLYQVFCQQTGYGGTTQRETNEEVLAKLQPVVDARPISIYFQRFVGVAVQLMS